MRKRHFLCKEITDMQWEVTDGKVSEKDGHTDMERTGMKTVIKKGIKDILSENKKTKEKVKESLQAICKNKRRVFLCFFRKTRGKKQQIPAVLTVEAALVIPLFLLGICTLLGIMDLYRVQALVKTSLHQSAQELGMYASVESGDYGVNTPTGVLSSGVCIAYAKAHLPELGDGAAVSLIGSRYENHKIQLKATVLYQLPFPSFRYQNLR